MGKMASSCKMVVQYRLSWSYQITPYEAIYGQKHLLVASYLPSASKVWGLNITLHTRESILHKTFWLWIKI